MPSVTRLGLAFIAVCALGAVTASSASASPLFLSHPSGLLLATPESKQVFLNPANQYECTGLKLLPPGDVTVSLRALSLLLVVDYEKCTLGPLAVLHLHPFRWLVDANGLLSLKNDVLILGTKECTISWLASKNQSLSKVSFSNVAGGLLLSMAVKGMSSEGKGGCEFNDEGEGFYNGSIRLEVEGGLIRWDP